MATSIIAWEGDDSPGLWREYEGSVQDWLTQRARSQSKKLSYKEQRELDALPAQIAALEAEQSDTTRQLQGGQLYGTDAALAAQLAQRQAQIEAQLLQCLERWEALGS